MQIILFALYYLKLNLSVSFGIYPISEPLTVKWQWQKWQQRQQARRVRAF